MDRLEANAGMQTVSIKGKDYVQVNQRVLAFWQVFPNGRIVTRKLNDDGERCDFEAAVYRNADDADPAATGNSFEVKGASYINKTSYVENCETSAVGRALGFLGFGCDASIASAEEVDGAVGQQEAAIQAQRPVKQAQQPAANPNGLDYSALAPIARQRAEEAWGGDWEAHLADMKRSLFEKVRGCTTQEQLDAEIEGMHVSVEVVG